MRKLIFTKYGKMNIKVTESKNKPFFIGIHGVMASLEYFDLITPYLTPHFGVISVDLLGNGDSNEPLNEHYSIEKQASAIWEVIEALNISEKVIIGRYSMGGAVAVAMAELKPESIYKLIIFDTSVDMSHAKLSPIFSYLDKPIIGSFLKFMINYMRAPKKAPASFAEDFNMNSLENPDFIMEAARKMSKNAMIQTQKMFPAYTSKSPLDIRLIQLNIPTLVLFGDKDRIAGTNGLKEDFNRYSKLSNVTFQLITGSGHTPIVEKPSETAQQIIKFVG